MKKTTYLLLLCLVPFFSSNAQQELLDGDWILDYVVVESNTYFAPPLFSQTPACLPIGYYPGISFGIDGTGEYEASAILTFNSWFHVGSDPMTIDSDSFTTQGAVTLGACDCICELEDHFLSTILAGDFTTRTFNYTIENISGKDTLTITTPEGDIAVFYDNILSIDELENEQAFKIYPVPSSKELNIYVENTTIQTINIFSITGENIIRYTDLVPSSIDISDFANGVYFIEVISKEGRKSVQRFLKN